MKLSMLLPGRKTTPLLALLCATGLMPCTVVAQTNEPARAVARPPAGSNAPSAVLCIPLSAFVIPNTPAEGRDPFFPLSTRRAPPEVVKTNTQPVLSFDLQLKGVSGPADRRLAIINNRTVQAGEETEVTTSTGKVRIRCLDIKTETVVVQIGPERRELRLRPGI